MGNKFNQLDYEEFFLIKGCNKPQKTQAGNLKLKNSMNLECELEFLSQESSDKWQALFEKTAAEIDKKLGKESSTNLSRSDTMKSSMEQSREVGPSSS